MMRIVGLLAALGAALAATPAAACSCMPQTRAQAIERTQFVFEGRVLSSRVAGSNAFTVFEVLRPIKGAVQTRVEVSSRIHAAACGVTFEKGQVATVGATFREYQFFTNSCLIFSLNRKGR
jgi:hypothetical protein